MKRAILPLIAVATFTAAGFVIARAASDGRQQPTSNGIAIPAGYRDWTLISLAREEGKLDDLRAVLGNDIATKAAREEKLPFPDGAIIARLAWSYDPLEESERAFGRPQSYVAGRPKNGIQFMVKDAAKYAATGGWGFAQFDDGKPVESGAALGACHSCHLIVKDRDLVFNRYAADPPDGARR